MKKVRNLFLVILFSLVALGFYGCHQFSGKVQSLRETQKVMLSQLSRQSLGHNVAKAESLSNVGTTTTTVMVQSSQKTEKFEPRVSTKEMLERLDQQPLVNVCRWIDGASGLSKMLRQQLSDGRFLKFSESLIQVEGELAPVYFQSRLPMNREFMLLLDKESSLTRDAKISVMIYRADTELRENLAKAEQIQTQAYYAWVLARIVMKNPSLMGDGNVMALCSRFQDTENSLSSEEMSDKIYRLMDRAQIKPDEFRFNPKFKSKIEVKWGDQGAYYHGLSLEFHPKNEP